MLLALISPALACDADALLERVQTARTAFVDLEADAFRAAINALPGDVACLEAPLTPEQAAQVHFATALAGFLARQEDLTVTAFQAALAADPDIDFESWLPKTHPVYVEFRLASRVSPDPATELDPEGTLWRDGAESTAFVLTQPAILQQQQGSAISASHLHLPEQPLPDWAPEAPEPLDPRFRRRILLGSATAVSATATGILLATAASSQARFPDPDTDPSDLSLLRDRANLTSQAAIGAGVATAGLAVGLSLSW